MIISVVVVLLALVLSLVCKVSTAERLVASACPDIIRRD